MKQLWRRRPQSLGREVKGGERRRPSRNCDEPPDHPLGLSAPSVQLMRAAGVGALELVPYLSAAHAAADVSSMRSVRIVQIAGAGTVVAGCALFLLNVQTSANAWRHANPTRAQGRTVNIPEKQAARDASGQAGWSWPEGTPGWRPGERIQGYPVAGATAKELVRARVSAARAGLEGTGVRVVDAIRATSFGLLAILAAPMADDPARTCLGAMLEPNAKVEWLCPGRGRPGSDLGNSPALIVATSLGWPGAPGTDRNKHPLYLLGVARGDVRRVVLSAPGFESERIYERGHTWGQFDAAWMVLDSGASLRIYGQSGLLEVVRLAIRPGKTRVLIGSALRAPDEASRAKSSQGR